MQKDTKKNEISLNKHLGSLPISKNNTKKILQASAWTNIWIKHKEAILKNRK